MRVGRYARIGIGVAAVGVLGVGAAAVAGGNQKKFSEHLTGYRGGAGHPLDAGRRDVPGDDRSER